MALRQVYSNFWVGLESELPATRPAGSRFLAEDAKRFFGYDENDLPFEIGGVIDASDEEIFAIWKDQTSIGRLNSQINASQFIININLNAGAITGNFFSYNRNGYGAFGIDNVSPSFTKERGKMELLEELEELMVHLSNGETYYLRRDADADAANNSPFGIFRIVQSTQSPYNDLTDNTFQVWSMLIVPVKRRLQAISIRDNNDVEQFSVTESIQLQGGTFDPSNKRFSVDPLSPFTFYVDVLNGNNATAEISNYNKPFSTLDFVIDEINNIFSSTISSQRNYLFFRVHLISNGTYPVTKMPNSSVEYYSENLVNIDFSSATSQVFTYPYHNIKQIHKYNIPRGNIIINKSFSGLFADMQYYSLDITCNKITYNDSASGTGIRCYNLNLNVEEIEYNRPLFANVYYRNDDGTHKINVNTITCTANAITLFNLYVYKKEIEFNIGSLETPSQSIIGKLVAFNLVENKPILNIGNVMNFELIRNSCVLNFIDSIFENSVIPTGNNAMNQVTITGSIREYICYDGNTSIMKNYKGTYDQTQPQYIWKDFAIYSFNWNNPTNISGASRAFLPDDYAGQHLYLDNVRIINCPFRLFGCDNAFENIVIDSVLTTNDISIPVFYERSASATPTNIDVYGELYTNMDFTSTNITVTNKTPIKL